MLGTYVPPLNFKFFRALQILMQVSNGRGVTSVAGFKWISSPNQRSFAGGDVHIAV
jgi:hypothetical protein